jgi:hypothetical protein
VLPVILAILGKIL